MAFLGWVFVWFRVIYGPIGHAKHVENCFHSIIIPPYDIYRKLSEVRQRFDENGWCYRPRPTPTDMAVFWVCENPFGSNISPLCVLQLLKMKREANIVSTLHIDIKECSSTMLWLDFRSQQAANRCWYAFGGGSDHPFWVRCQYIVGVAIVENETRAQHSLYVIYGYDGM